MSKYHTDGPITGEQTAPDLLNRTKFSDHLANALLLDTHEECLTVSLEGEWGYGKSSVINLVKNSLGKSNTPPVIIEYNPWLAGNPKSLIQDFLLQFSSQLNIKIPSDESLRAGKELIAYSSLFGVAKLIPGAEPWATVLEKALSGFGKSAKKIAEIKKLDLLDRKKKVVTAIQKMTTPIVVIIDDIDRLTPAETFQVLRLTKAVADFPGTAFLLAFDPNYLTTVLGKNAIDNPEEYINKIIQLRVPLPIISQRNMHELVDIQLTRMGDFIDSFDGDQDRLGLIYHTYFKHLIKNPREIKRFFNHLNFIFERAGRDVCFADLFSLSLIAIKSPKTYEHIKKSPAAYLGRRLAEGHFSIEKPQDVVKFYEAERNTTISDFDEGDKKLLVGILGEIFPLLDSKAALRHDPKSPDAAGRVATLPRLYMALHYGAPAEYVSDAEVQDFISGKMNRRKFIKRILSEELDERFFDVMFLYGDKCKSDSNDILAAVYDEVFDSERLKRSFEKNHSFIPTDLYTRMRWLTENILSETASKEDLISFLVGREESIPIGGDILYDLRKQHVEEAGQPPWASADKLSEYERVFQSTARQALLKKTFKTNHLESHIFFELARSSNKKASELLSEVFEAEGILRVAEIIGRAGSDSVNGPYTQINSDFFGPIADLNLLRKEARRTLNKDGLPHHIQSVLKSLLDGKKYYLRDGREGRD